jgi:hypothetical protein
MGAAMKFTTSTVAVIVFVYWIALVPIWLVSPLPHDLWVYAALALVPVIVGLLVHAVVTSE